MRLFEDLAPDHLPPILAEAAVENSHLPNGYVAAAVASFIASRLVYSEGINFVESLPRDRLAKVSLDFFIAQRSAGDAIDALADCDGLSEKDRSKIIALLQKGGARAGLKL